MEIRPLRQKWMFWRDDEMECMRKLLGDRYIVSRIDHEVTWSFYHGAIWPIYDYVIKLDVLADYDRIYDVNILAKMFHCAASALPRPYVIGVSEDLDKLIIGKPKKCIDDDAICHKGHVRGKWVLLDYEARCHEFHSHEKIQIRFDPPRSVFVPGERFYCEAISMLMRYGATVTQTVQLSKPDDVWEHEHDRLLPDMFKEAVNTLPDPFKVAITPDLMLFCVVEPYSSLEKRKAQ